MTDRRARSAWTILCAGLYAGLTVACGGSTNTPASLPQDVWAVVDGRQITRAEVEKAYRGVVQQPLPPSNEEALGMKLGLLDELITQDLLLVRARTLGLEATDTEVENALAERKRAVSDQDFQKQLTDRNLTLEDIKDVLRREMSVQKVLDREVAAKITISDQEISDFYNQNKAQFNLAETQYRLAQIVITPQRDPSLRNRMNDDAASPAEAQRKLNAVLERLRAGTDFATMAIDYSEDPATVERGGDLGFIPESALRQAPPALRDTVLKMQPGSVNTVNIGGHYTILTLISREAAGVRELSTPAVRDGIRDALKDRKEQLMRTAYITAARDEANVVNNLARMVTAGNIPAALPAPAPAAAAN